MMADQLTLDFSHGEDSDPTGSREARRHAWVEANRIARSSSPSPAPAPGEADEDLLDLAARSGASSRGFENWEQEQRERNEDFARGLGLPLGRRVEVVLANGTTLRGLLTLGCPGKTAAKLPRGTATERAARTLLPLLVGRTPATAGEIASCVRLD